MSQKRCKDCENPLPDDAVYCGRCGAGVRQVPLGCAALILLMLAAAAYIVLRYLSAAL